MSAFTVKYVVHTSYLVPVEAETGQAALAWVASLLNEDVDFMGIPMATETTIVAAYPTGAPIGNTIVRTADREFDGYSRG